MRRSGPTWILFLLVFPLYYCKPSEEEDASDRNNYELEIPKGFPQPEIPDDNQLTAKRVALGKKLFFDPILSLDSSISCGSCHFQAHAFSDTVLVSTGVHGRNGTRNAPPLFNLAWSRSFFRDGGVPTLEMQVLSPIETEEEMHLNIVVAVERLKQHPLYPALIREAYGRETDVFSITRAIAAFERTLISGNSRYDQYIFQGNTAALSDTELAGMELFFNDKTNCSVCHAGFNFTNQQLENNGLQENYEDDPGRMRITLRPGDEGKFKVPSLRNIALTAPYMHNGSLASLEDVIDHYASGGSEHVNKNKLISGFEISEKEKQALIAFLRSLTDSEFTKNEAFYP